MKKYSYISMLAVAAMAAFSCAKETENQNDAVKPEVKTPLVITAYTDDDIAPDTKTSLSGVSVVWTTTDVIAGYEGVTKHTSTSTAVSDGGKKATFTFSEVSVDADLEYLVYPAAAAGAYDAGLININLPSEQTAVANSFANGANLSLAEGLVDDDAVLFKNLGGLIGIQINNDDIASVKFSANEAMTGAGVVDPSDCSTLCDGAKYVKLSGGLANGTPYYAVIYPGTYSGLQIEVTNTSGQVATYTNSTPLTIARNGNLFIAELTIPSGKWVTPTKGSEYSWTLESGDLGVSATPATSVIKGSPLTTWDTAFTWSSSAFLSTDGTKGVQVGSGSNPCSALTLSTSGYTQYVESVVVNFSHASSGGAALSVTVGDTALKNGEKTVVNATNTATAYTFNAASLVKGDIVLRFTNSASKAFYVKSIVINPDTRTAVTLSFDDEAIDDQTTVSHTFTGQAVNSSTDATAVTSNIIWGITGDAITSSFSTSTGALVLNGSAGTATVTASFAGDENYKSANASYTITVSKVKLATPTSPVAAEKSGDDAIVVTLPTGISNVGSYSVTCTGETTQVVASGTPSVTFSSLADGSYTVTVTAIPSDTSVYLNSDAWSSSEIIVGTSSLYATLYDSALVLPQGTNTGYESRSYTDDKGNTWETVSACANPSKSPTYPMIQLRAQTSTKAAYIQIPTMPYDIKTISFIVTGSSATAEDGAKTAVKLQFQETAAYNASVILEGGGTSTNSITLNFAGKSYKTGYITADGSLRIWKIVVEY